MVEATKRRQASVFPEAARSSSGRIAAYCSGRITAEMLGELVRAFECYSKGGSNL